MDTERRAKQRFPFERRLNFRVLKTQVWHEGQTFNMSSSGILFGTNADLSPGMRVDARLEWPVALNGTAHLILVVEGTVVRHHDGITALVIEKYKFRTAGRVLAMPLTRTA